MTVQKVTAIVGATLLWTTVSAGELLSDPAFVFLRPETSSFWNTATNNSMTMPIDYPFGATQASLIVKGLGYNRVYSDITDNTFTIELPAATSAETENVYDLVLTFNDAARTTRTAKLGLLDGVSSGAEGTTRCLAPSTAKVWSKVHGRVVLPIPYGTTSFTVNGVETNTGLDGAQGWYALEKVGAGETVSLSAEADGMEYMASLVGASGMMVIFR